MRASRGGKARECVAAWGHETSLIVGTTPPAQREH